MVGTFNKENAILQILCNVASHRCQNVQTLQLLISDQFLRASSAAAFYLRAHLSPAQWLGLLLVWS